MSIPVHISMDVETLDIRASAVVLSIGLAAFTMSGGLVATFYTRFNRKEQENYGRTSTTSTLAWWNLQSDSAKEVLGYDFKQEVRDTLDIIQPFFGRFNGGLYDIAGVWGYGSDFDNATVIDLYRHYQKPVPWSYKANRCGRTLVAIAQPEKPANTGTHHNALDDAIFQAEYIRRGLQKLGIHS